MIIFMIIDLLRDWKWPITIIMVVYLAVPPLAGKATSVAVFVDLVSKMGAEKHASWFATCATAVWALLERWQKRHKTSKLSGRIQELEAQLLPNRSSSNLDPTGDKRLRGKRS